MDPTLTTSRLKLTLIPALPPRGSPELAWLHELHSNEQARWWSIAGTSRSLSETEASLAPLFLTPDSPPSARRVLYAVHELAPLPQSDTALPSTPPTPTFIGTITLRTLESFSLPLDPPLVPAPNPTHPFLTLELAYQFLPSAWGKGYAVEALRAVFAACERRCEVWAPYERVWCRAIVNAGNAASGRVMEKLGWGERGVYEWRGRLWLAGGWRTEDRLRIFGRWVLGEEEEEEGKGVSRGLLGVESGG